MENIINHSPFLNDTDFFKSISLDNDTGTLMLKSVNHKYVKRTGSAGDYKYWYKDANGKLTANKKESYKGHSIEINQNPNYKTKEQYELKIDGKEHPASMSNKDKLLEYAKKNIDEKIGTTKKDNKIVEQNKNEKNKYGGNPNFTKESLHINLNKLAKQMFDKNLMQDEDFDKIVKEKNLSRKQSMDLHGKLSELGKYGPSKKEKKAGDKIIYSDQGTRKDESATILEYDSTNKEGTKFYTVKRLSDGKTVKVSLDEMKENKESQNDLQHNGYTKAKQEYQDFMRMYYSAGKIAQRKMETEREQKEKVVLQHFLNTFPDFETYFKKEELGKTYKDFAGREQKIGDSESDKKHGRQMYNIMVQKAKEKGLNTEKHEKSIKDAKEIQAKEDKERTANYQADIAFKHNIDSYFKEQYNKQKFNRDEVSKEFFKWFKRDEIITPKNQKAKEKETKSKIDELIKKHKEK